MDGRQQSMLVSWCSQQSALGSRSWPHLQGRERMECAFHLWHQLPHHHIAGSWLALWVHQRE